jgi:hypothetical protein
MNWYTVCPRHRTTSAGITVDPHAPRLSHWGCRLRRSVGDSREVGLSHPSVQATHVRNREPGWNVRPVLDGVRDARVGQSSGQTGPVRWGPALV